MRAKEFIQESRVGSIQDDSASALPATYAIPALQNQDPYKQYRFGVAIAAAKGRKDPHDVGQDFQASSPWGENQIVVSYSNTVDDYIDDALKLVGLSPSDKKLISTPHSEETKDVGTHSPVANWMKKK
jgi:hypothetical protein